MGRTHKAVRDPIQVDTPEELVNAIRTEFSDRPPTRFRQGTILGPIRATRGRHARSFIVSGKWMGRYQEGGGPEGWISLHNRTIATIKAAFPDSHGTSITDVQRPVKGHPNATNINFIEVQW